MEDSFIVDLYWRRDETAIARTDEKYGRLCRKISDDILSSREDSEECVADTYLALWNCIPPQRPEHLGAYLFRTVRNAAFSRFRADSAQKRGGGEASAALDELAECVAGRDNVEQIIEARELSHAVNAFLHTPPATISLFPPRRSPKGSAAGREGYIPRFAAAGKSCATISLRRNCCESAGYYGSGRRDRR